MAEMTLGDGIDLLQRRAKIVKTLLIIGFGVTVALLIGEFGELNGDISLADPDPSQAVKLYIAILFANTAVTLITVVFFAMWIYRAAANVVAANVVGFDFTPGWAVGWYFVPFANLVQPFLAMRQIWNASHSGGSDLDRGDPMALFATHHVLPREDHVIDDRIGVGPLAKQVVALEERVVPVAGVRDDQRLQRHRVLLHQIADAGVGVDHDLVGQAARALAIIVLVADELLAETPMRIGSPTEA